MIASLGSLKAEFGRAVLQFIILSAKIGAICGFLFFLNTFRSD